MIIGIAVGAAALIAIVSIVVFYALKKKKLNAKDNAPTQSMEGNFTVNPMQSFSVGNNNPLYDDDINDSRDPFNEDFDEDY